jgi:hypothetical protein
MSTDKTDTTSPISRVDTRLVPPRRVRQAKAVGVDVRLNQARRSFAALAAAAESPPLQFRHQFEIEGLEKIRTLRLGKFHVADEATEERVGFTLSFEYQGRDALKHVTEAEITHNALRKSLYAHGLVFRSVSSATVFKLEVSAAVPAFVTVTAVPDAAVITLQMHNILTLGDVNYDIPADALDRRMVDALIELVARGDRDFFGIVQKSGKRAG